MTIDNILKSTESFKLLKNGAHPSEFCANINISLDTHFDFIETNSIYRQKFMEAMTECLAYWHKYADLELTTRQILSANIVQVTRNTVKEEKFNLKYWELKIKDLERYLPIISILEPNVSDITNEIQITVLKDIDLRKSNVNNVNKK